jgi:hypothetical protein
MLREIWACGKCTRAVFRSLTYDPQNVNDIAFTKFFSPPLLEIFLTIPVTGSEYVGMVNPSSSHTARVQKAIIAPAAQIIREAPKLLVM